MTDLDLEIRRRPARRDAQVKRDWSPSTRNERAIDELYGRLEDAREELSSDFLRVAKNLGCRDRFLDAPGDPLSAILTVYDDKFEHAFADFMRALRV